MQNPAKLVKALTQMQAQMSAMQKTLAEKVFEGTAGGGLVTVKLRGDGRMEDLVVDPAVLQEEPGMVSDLVRAAYNVAWETKEAESKAQLTGVAGKLSPLGLAVPGVR